jgi:uncharacterized protein HemX
MGDARSRWATLRHDLDAAAATTKDSQPVILELSRRYAALSAEEKQAVDGLLAEWVLADDPNLRFDAIALIADHNVRSAVPSLRALAHRLEDRTDPSAPYEWAKVNRLLGLLAGPTEP